MPRASAAVRAAGWNALRQAPTNDERDEGAPAGGSTIVASRYRVGRLLGRGGMGAVYEAWDLELRRHVAVKTLLPHVLGDDGRTVLLIKEARAAASIDHPGIVRVFDLVRDDETAYVVMERLEGEDLGARIAREGKLDPSFVRRLGVELADAIAAAHAHDVLHRDLKPSNVFITRDPRLGETFKVLDFGVAKLLRVDSLVASTTTGRLIGTPHYCAPERIAADMEADGRADVYSIGVILYEALVGHPPYTAKTYPALLLKMSTSDAPRVDTLRFGLPAGLGAVIARAMHRVPEQRFQSADALAEALRAQVGSLEPGTHVASARVPAAEESGGQDSGEHAVPLAQPPRASPRPAPGDLATADTLHSAAAGTLDAVIASRRRARVVVGLSVLAVAVLAALSWQWSPSPSASPSAPVSASASLQGGQSAAPSAKASPRPAPVTDDASSEPPQAAPTVLPATAVQPPRALPAAPTSGALGRAAAAEPARRPRAASPPQAPRRPPPRAPQTAEVVPPKPPAAPAQPPPAPAQPPAASSDAPLQFEPEW